MLDVRTPEEYEAGHLRGARSAPGGQLVQETDAHIATWGARVVLVDDNGVRATMTASWLKQMGWTDVAVLVAGPADGDWETGPACAARARARSGAVAGASMPPDLRDRLAAGDVVVIDLDTEPALCAGPYSRRLVRDPQRASPTDLAKLPAGRGDRADVARWRAGAAGGGRVAAAASVPVHGPGRRHRGLGPGGLAARNRS